MATHAPILSQKPIIIICVCANCWCKAEHRQAHGVCGAPNSKLATTLPSHVLDLSAFQLQLPLQGKVNEVTIFQPALSTYQNPQLFHSNGAACGVTFVCYAGGATTEHSDFPRTELAQTEVWNIGDRRVYTMSLTGATMRLTPVRPQVVIAQVFGAGGWLVQIRLNSTSNGTKILAMSKLYERLNITILDPSYTLGKPYAIRLTAGRGVIRVYIGAGSTVPAASYVIPGLGAGAYFKAGNYLQSNNITYAELGNATSEVVVYTLTLS